VGHLYPVSMPVSYLFKLPECNFMPDPEDTSNGAAGRRYIEQTPTCVDAVCSFHIVLVVGSAWGTLFYSFSAERRRISAFHVRNFSPGTGRPSQYQSQSLQRQGANSTPSMEHCKKFEIVPKPPAVHYAGLRLPRATGRIPMTRA
jgi:hypothetical protein